MSPHTVRAYSGRTMNGSSSAATVGKPGSATGLSGSASDGKASGKLTS
jgi:hypothetical protein